MLSAWKKNFILFTSLMLGFSASAKNVESTGDAQAEAMYALSKIFEANHEVTKKQSFDSTPVCTGGCTQPLPTDMDMRCTSENSYLEDKFVQMSSGKNPIATLLADASSEKPIVRSECVRISQETVLGADSKKFRSCDEVDRPTKVKGVTEKAMQMTRVKRPCVSETYQQLVEKSFSITAACMESFTGENSEEDIKSDFSAMFSMLSVESGLHVNAMSGRGSAGIGQFISDEIKYINDYRMTKAAASIQDHASPKCQKLGMALNDSQNWMKPKVSCDQVGVDNGNPLLGIIYTHIALKFTVGDLEKKILNAKPYASKIQMPASERRKLLRGLAIWSHNTGRAGLKVPLKALLLNESKKVGKFTTADQILSKLDDYVRSHPHSANASEDRRKETSNYYSKMKKNLERTERMAGGKECML